MLETLDICILGKSNCHCTSMGVFVCRYVYEPHVCLLLAEAKYGIVFPGTGYRQL